MAADLAADGTFEVTVADWDPGALERLRAVPAHRKVEADLSDAAAVRELARQHELVIGAVPASLGYGTVEAALEAGSHVADISFFEEDPLALDELARRQGVAALVDCGISPGLSALVLGHVESLSDQVERYVCYVGGLPVDSGGLFRYKAPFSPIDVIEVYTRSARYKASGSVHTVPALSGVEQIEVGGVGTLEAFLTDGLRTLLHDERVPDMRELTLRYPGHAAQMRLLAEMGLFDTEPIEVDGSSVRPRDVAARLLFPAWEFGPGEADITVLRLEIDIGGAAPQRLVFELLDRYDEATGISSMARTTGYTCTAMVHLVAAGLWTKHGVAPPEAVGREPGCYEHVVEYLAQRGVVLEERVEARP
jgi:saccharopine dehydrogenase-like NADP-dependent oxidoreductase